MTRALTFDVCSENLGGEIAMLIQSILSSQLGMLFMKRRSLNIFPVLSVAQVALRFRPICSLLMGFAVVATSKRCRSKGPRRSGNGICRRFDSPGCVYNLPTALACNCMFCFCPNSAAAMSSEETFISCWAALPPFPLLRTEAEEARIAAMHCSVAIWHSPRARTFVISS